MSTLPNTQSTGRWDSARFTIIFLALSFFAPKQNPRRLSVTLCRRNPFGAYSLPLFLKRIIQQQKIKDGQ